MPAFAARAAPPARPFEPMPDHDEPQDDVRQRIEDLLGPSPVAVDELVRQSGATPGDVHLLLLEIDLAGRLDRHAGGRVSLAA